MSVFRNMLMEITSQPPTPSYTELRCLTSTGTQFINTGIYPSINTAIEIEMQYTENTTQGKTQVFGARGTWNNGFYLGTNSNNAPSSNTKFWYLIGGTYNFAGVNVADFNKHKIYLDKDQFKVDNNITNLSGVQSFQAYNTIGIFGAYDGGNTPPQTSGIYKMYYCKIWESNVLVRDFIPVLDENNVACLYDKVSNQFFYNAGTGTFNYELDTYTITFNSNGGWTEYQPVTVNAGQSIDLSQYTIGEGDPGAEFGGWTSTKNDDATLLPSTFTPTEDITIYAYWQPELSLSPISYNSQANALGFKNIVNLSSALSSSYIDHLDDSGGDSFEIQHNGEQVGGIDIYHDEVVYVDINLNTTGVDGKIDSLSFKYASNADFAKFTGTGSYFDDELNEYTLNMCFNEVDSFDNNYEPLYLNLYNSDTQSEYFTDAMNLVSQLVYYRYDGE